MKITNDNFISACKDFLKIYMFIVLGIIIGALLSNYLRTAARKERIRFNSSDDIELCCIDWKEGECLKFRKRLKDDSLVDFEKDSR